MRFLQRVLRVCDTIEGMIEIDCRWARRSKPLFSHWVITGEGKSIRRGDTDERRAANRHRGDRFGNLLPVRRFDPSLFFGEEALVENHEVAVMPVDRIEVHFARIPEECFDADLRKKLY